MLYILKLFLQIVKRKLIHFYLSLYPPQKTDKGERPTLGMSWSAVSSENPDVGKTRQRRKTWEG
jgi:hypothetical protein